MAKKIVSAIISGALFAGLIFMLRTYDVGMDQYGNAIGFYHINTAFHQLTGENMAWYDLTELLGYVALAVCGIFALAGLIQMIRRKSLLKVDRTIFALAALYIVVIGCYAFFEKCIINYRPVIMPGNTVPEASFPSSHTMLIVTVMASTIMVTGKYIKNRFLRTLINTLCFIAAVVTVCGRLYSGVHWLTDIIGGLLLSITILELFSIVLSAAKRADSSVPSAPSDQGYVPKH